MKLLILIDFQKDFIDGSLGTPEAQAIVPKVLEKVKNWCDPIVYTLDTHQSNYLETQEGKKLPILHCIEGTTGWEIPEEIKEELDCNSDSFYATGYYEKDTFGSTDLCFELNGAAAYTEFEEIQICGLCTDICVISNALMVKAACPNTRIIVDASCCAGTTPENHKKALDIMKGCHIDVINE